MNISKEKIKLIACDLDGTLLNDKKEIGNYTKEILNKLINDYKIELILSSGRGFDGVKKYNDVLGNNNCSIIMNGSNIVDNNGKILYRKSLEEDISKIVIKLAEKYDILAINLKDVENAEKAGVKKAFIDRLTLTKKRIEDMADGLKQIASLNDPVGEFIYGKTLPNGLIIQQKRVPLGVVAIIFESRPNVTADAFGLCLKSGNAVILRGGKEAINTNIAIVNVFKKVLKNCGINENAVQILEDTSHDTANKLMKAHQYIDVLIPRGSARLINTVIENSTIPCIQTGIGNCHIFVDESGNLTKAIDIIINAKTQRPGVCNAVETLLIHKNCAEALLP